MSCRAPGPKLDPLIELWPAGQVVHVIHDSTFEPESFNPGVDAAGTLRNPTRFAPIRDSAGQVVPYLYGGSTLECAIFETVFHNVPIDASDKFVDLDDFANRAHGRIVPRRDLQLVNLVPSFEIPDVRPPRIPGSLISIRVTAPRGTWGAAGRI